MSYQPRHPLKVCKHVWHALFMREAMARMSADRFGWSWILLEPVLHLFIMIAVRQLMGRMKYMQGAEFIPWLIIGIITFLVFRDTMMRSMGAIRANSSLFAYRQVHPIDPVLSRAFLEFTIRSVVLTLIVVSLMFFGGYHGPDEPLIVIAMWLLAWWLGLSFGLVLSVVATIAEEVEKVIKLLIFPLYMLSGAVLPLKILPHSLRDVLMYNPLVHVLELLRHAYFHGYYMLSGVSLLYPVQCALVASLLGLMLHVRFKSRLMSA